MAWGTAKLSSSASQARLGGEDHGEGPIARYFKLEERGTTVIAEIRAGVVTFLTMSYILVVNPQILSQMGIPSGDVVIATAVASGVASIACGLLGNLPFGLAPGTGLSAYMSYGLVLGGALTRKQALTASFISGIVTGISAATHLSDVIMKVIPRAVKVATVVGMGLLIALIGMISIDLVVPNKDTLVTLGDLKDYHIWLALGGLVIIGTLLYHQVKGGMLVGVALVTAVVWCVDRSAPHGVKGVLAVPKLELGAWNNLSWHVLSVDMVPAVLAFLMVGIFDVSGVVYGLATLARIVNEEDGSVPGSIWAFLCAGLGTLVAAMAGCSPLIIHVESAAGIREGGRTGLTAVVVGLLFLCSVVFTPLLTHVPPSATAPILILLGAMMIGESQHIDWADMSQAIPAFLTCMMMPFTFSIPNGILFGIGMSVVFFITTGEFLVYLAPYWQSFKGSRGDGRSRVNGNAPADESTHLQYAADGEFPAKRPSIFDDQHLSRRLSLIVPKEDADKVEELSSPHASGRLGGSASSHPRPGAASYTMHL